jgi:putative heme-binding domain-containing protein
VPRIALLLLGGLCLCAQTPTADPTTGFNTADLARGKQLFVGHCAPCHGIDGSGGRGANLTVPKLKRAADNSAFFDLVQNGIEGTSMDGAWQLSDSEIWHVVAFVRSLGRTAISKLPGDPARGRAVYDQEECASCHIIKGVGSSFGPELTIIGAQRSLVYLRESIVNPSADIQPDYVSVRVRTRDGKVISGIRVNEDSFTIQIKDAENRFHSFRKADLAVVDIETGESAMPVYGGLSAAQLDDLVSYLASLRGEQ